MRYSKFMELDASLRARFGELLKDVVLPPNTYLGSSGMEFQQKRAEGLNQYLQAVVAADKLSSSGELRAFLNFAKRAQLGTPGGTAPGTPGSNMSRRESEMPAGFFSSPEAPPDTPRSEGGGGGGGGGGSPVAGGGSPVAGGGSAVAGGDGGGGGGSGGGAAAASAPPTKSSPVAAAAEATHTHTPTPPPGAAEPGKTRAPTGAGTAHRLGVPREPPSGSAAAAAAVTLRQPPADESTPPARLPKKALVVDADAVNKTVCPAELQGGCCVVA
jgi:hypothetical protein